MVELFKDRKERRRREKHLSSRNFTERPASSKWDWTGLRKNLDLSIKEKVLLIDRESKVVPVKRQAQLLGIGPSTVYYQPVVDPYNLELMHLIDEQYTKTPFYGSRRMREALRTKGYNVNRKKIQRLMGLTGMEAIYPKRNLSNPYPGCKIYPYLLVKYTWCVGQNIASSRDTRRTARLTIRPEGQSVRRVCKGSNMVAAASVISAIGGAHRMNWEHH